MNTFFKKGGLGSQKGFASLLLILAVAVVGVVAGYVAFDKQKNITPAIPSYDGLVSTSTLPVANKSLGANGTEIPTSIALFETSLSSKITNVATSMTLVSATDKAGTTLASSTYAFIIDEGKANEEMVLADCTSTACANMIRGLSPLTGTTTVSSLKFAHNRGASVKITDGPQLLILSRMANGQNDYPNLIRYKSGVTVTSADSDQTLASKGYVLNTANAGAATSTESRGGIVELGTLAEQASSYDGGSDKPTVLQTKNSTSTCQVVGSYNIVASTTTGKLDKGCFDQTANYSFSGTNTFSGTTATTTFDGGVKLNKSGTGIEFFDGSILTVAPSAQIYASSTAGVGSWTKPSGAKVVEVYVVAGGGGGGSGKNGASSVSGGSGGGGGSLGFKRFNASALGSTEAFTIGAGGAGGAGKGTAGDGNIGSVGSDTSFGTTALLVAKGGSAGLGGTTGSPAGGAGGVVGNGDVQVVGGAGGAGDNSDVPGATGVDTTSAISPRGGGAGGGLNASAVGKNGGVGGGFVTNYVKAGGAIGTIGNSSITLLYGGTGGGGSTGGTTSATGGAGIEGSGGGGSGAGSTASGTGGAGGAGFIIVITYF